MKKFLLLTVFVFLGIAIAGIWHYTHKKPEKITTPVIVPSKKVVSKPSESKLHPHLPPPSRGRIKESGKVVETKKPEWMKGLLALHQKYYPGWKQAETGSSNLTGTSTYSKSNYKGSSSYSGSARSSSGSSRTPGSRTSSGVSSASKSTPDKSTSPASQTSQNDSPGSGGGSPQPDSSPPDSGENGDDNDDEDEPPQQNAVSIVRSINGTNVTLTITVNEQISGLIISESIPSSYQIPSSSPNYAKKRENTYKWLFYGKSIDSQSINYTLEGTGGGTISGNYKSSKGSGNITGYSQL